MRRSWLLARRNRDTRCPASATRSNCSYEIQLYNTVLQRIPFRQMTMETRMEKRETEKERERKGRKVSIGGNVYLPIYLSIEETEGGLGWTNRWEERVHVQRGREKVEKMEKRV